MIFDTCMLIASTASFVIAIAAILVNSREMRKTQHVGKALDLFFCSLVFCWVVLSSFENAGVYLARLTS
jgi:hypothetical protein